MPEFVKKEHETTKTLENIKESNTNINRLINKTQELLREDLNTPSPIKYKQKDKRRSKSLGKYKYY